MTRAKRTPPIIEAPPAVTGLAGVILLAHVLRVLAPASWQGFILPMGVLQTDRFWASMGIGAEGALPYNSPLEALIPLLASALLHDGWAGAILNAALIVIFGRLVHASLSIGRKSGAIPFLIVFAVSVVGGSLFHLITQYPAGTGLIGASGGASGLFAAWVLIQEGRGGRILTKRFLTVFLFFTLVNLALWLMGPSLLGAGISWQAHLGGFIAGAVAFQFFRSRRPVSRF
ncbi:rhomboid family intramembrane serine protease [Hyphomonas sp.]|uniref:rhomboid family intramembrane serine protease n=1 Tax=Hyphomonas sp. TaxID=87 RepID=UPI0035299097